MKKEPVQNIYLNQVLWEDLSNCTQTVCIILILHVFSNVEAFIFAAHYYVEKYQIKYNNPARGILDFCKQKFYRPLLCSPWTLHFRYTPCYELRTHPEHCATQLTYCETHLGHCATYLDHCATHPEHCAMP